MEKYCITQPQRFLIRYHDDGYKFVSVADDDAFPENNFIPNTPQPIGQLGTIIGSSLGLVCFLGPRNVELEMNVAVIWNPTIKKSITIPLPNVKFNFEGVFGFGVCPVTCDPKFVKIENVSREIVGKSTILPWDAEVFTLTSRVWRRPLSMLPHKHMAFDYPRFQVVIEGVIYWSGGVRSSDLETHVNAIISFNLTNEEFREINVPGCLAHKHFDINKLRESLVLFHCNKELEPNVLKVWMMDHDGSSSFTNTFNIYVPYEPIWRIHGFQKNDRLILAVAEEGSQVASLEVYDPTEDASVDIEIYGDLDLYIVSSYTESLLLLDQPEDV